MARIGFLAFFAVLACGAPAVVSVSPPPTTTPKPVPFTITNVGCFRDQGNAGGPEGRDLDGLMLALPNLTTAACTDTCVARGFPYAATQNGDQCFCGMHYGRNGPSSDCTAKCRGNPAEICGGGWANTVYQVGPPPTDFVPPVPPPPPPEPKPEPPPTHDPEVHFADADVAAAQVAASVWRPAVHPVVGPWSIRYPEITQATRDACAAMVASRLGPGLQLEEIDKYKATVTRLGAPDRHAVLAEKPSVARPQLSYLEMARRTRALLQQNADLFGLAAGDLPKIPSWTVAYAGANVWAVSGSYSSPGTVRTLVVDRYGNPTMGGGRSVAFDAQIHADGRIVWLRVAVDQPEAQIGSRAPLTDAQVRAYPGIVGALLVHRNTGQSYRLKASDIGTISRFLWVNETPNGRELTIEHQMTVSIPSLAPVGAGRWMISIQGDGKVLLIDMAQS